MFKIKYKLVDGKLQLEINRTLIDKCLALDECDWRGSLEDYREHYNVHFLPNLDRNSHSEKKNKSAKSNESKHDTENIFKNDGKKYLLEKLSILENNLISLEQDIFRVRNASHVLNIESNV